MPTDNLDLDLALYHVVRCAADGKPCAALLAELRRLYAAAGEPLPKPIRQPVLYELLDDGYTIVPTHELLRQSAINNPQSAIEWFPDV
jgi:hypothetical protein